MKYCMEITSVFGSQQQNNVINLIGLKNNYNGVMRGPYLSRGDKGHRTPENCLYP